MAKTILTILMGFMLSSSKSTAQLTLKSNSDSAQNKTFVSVLPQNFYKQQLGFFCKKESQLQKHTSLNLFIRLGNKDYVDYLEKKPNVRGN